MKIKVNKIKIKEIYIYFILVLIFYTSGSIYNFVFYNLNEKIKFIFCICASLSIFVCSRKEIHSLFVFIAGSLFLVLWAILGNAYLDNIFTTFIRILSVYIFLLFCENKKIDILEYLYKVIFLIAIIYLIAWMLFDYGPFSKFGTSLVVEINKNMGYESSGKWIYTNFFNIYFRWKNERKVLGMTIYASNGPFWEPGLYQIYLNFALWYGLLHQKKINYLKIIILIIAVISTTSTTGIFLLFIILGVFFYKKMEKKTAVCFLIPIGLVLYKIFTYVWNEKMINSLTNIQSRYNDTIFLVEKCLEHPIFGNGMGNTPAFNALLLYVVDFGILGFVLFLFYILKLFTDKNELAQKIVLTFWLILSLINEPIGYHSLVALILIMLYKTVIRKNCKYSDNNNKMKNT